MIRLIDASACSMFEVTTMLYQSGRRTKDLCYIPGVCLNACGINPIDSAIYCHTRGNSFEEQFVRVDCPVSNSLASSKHTIAVGQSFSLKEPPWRLAFAASGPTVLPRYSMRLENNIYIYIHVYRLYVLYYVMIHLYMLYCMCC